jgi:glycosyltransferase involved in cell wall biosynthesis
VTLFATADSATRAHLAPVWPKALPLGRPRSDPAVAQAAAPEIIARRAAEFDVIHCHLDWAHLPLLSRTCTPLVTTLHGRLDIPGLANLIRLFPKASFVSVSDSQRRPLPEANWLSTVLHGLPVDSLRASFEQGSYLAFLGRLSPEKGPHTAIRLAKTAGLPLRIAAKTPRGERRFFAEQLQPMIDGEQVQLIGEVNDSQKESFLGGALALPFPIKWSEPFGLVMIESMACGTPVIAFRHGSVPEIIEDGVSRFIVENEMEALARIACVHQLDRRGVRGALERRFTARRMAEEYVHHYERLRSMTEGLVKGEGFAVDASVMEANASRYHGKVSDELEWTDAQRRKRAIPSTGCWVPSCRETSSSPWARKAREGEIPPLTFVKAWPSAVDKLRFMIRPGRYSQCEIGVRKRTALRGGVRARSRESIFREMRGRPL